ncbi:hypothetical protein LTR94_037465, partial [Friedmanniomyces endolithicus]
SARPRSRPTPCRRRLPTPSSCSRIARTGPIPASRSCSSFARWKKRSTRSRAASTSSPSRSRCGSTNCSRASGRMWPSRSTVTIWTP